MKRTVQYYYAFHLLTLLALPLIWSSYKMQNGSGYPSVSLGDAVQLLCKLRYPIKVFNRIVQMQIST